MMSIIAASLAAFIVCGVFFITFYVLTVGENSDISKNTQQREASQHEERNSPLTEKNPENRESPAPLQQSIKETHLVSIEKFPDIILGEKALLQEHKSEEKNTLKEQQVMAQLPLSENEVEEYYTEKRTEEIIVPVEVLQKTKNSGEEEEQKKSPVKSPFQKERAKLSDEKKNAGWQKVVLKLLRKGKKAFTGWRKQKQKLRKQFIRAMELSVYGPNPGQKFILTESIIK